MTNAFKYSEAKNVKLLLRQENESYHLTFEDDGIGFVLEDVKSTNGLQNIRDRAVRINGILRIHTEKQNLSENRIGVTSITLEFKNTKSLKYGITF